MDDGLLDVCVFEKYGYLDALRFTPAVMLGAHTDMRGVTYFQTNRLVCTDTVLPI